MKKYQQREYEQLLTYKEKGYILTPVTLKLLCEAYHYNAARIGAHFMDVLTEYQNRGDLDGVWEDGGLVFGSTGGSV